MRKSKKKVRKKKKVLKKRPKRQKPTYLPDYKDSPGTPSYEIGVDYSVFEGRLNV
jgi:hypothetical protein